jgi:hypothetical protein
MLALALGLSLSFQQAPCPPEATDLVAEASVRAAEFDLPAAAEQLRAAVSQGCTSAEVAALYVRGLVDAREAFRQGGPPESLIPVRRAIAALEAIAQSRPGPAAIARLVLHAAAAAAQSERDEMRLYLESAIRMETLQRAASQVGAPLVTAAEMAGDLWLQVHRYEEARQSYADAARQVGSTPRVLAGLARAAVRLNDAAAACANYGMLLARWSAPRSEPPEIIEARAYLAQPMCTPASP